MTNILNSNRNNNVNSFAVITLIFTLVITSIITTNSFAQEAKVVDQLSTAQSSTIDSNELEWVEDSSEIFYPIENDELLTDQEVKNLKLEVKLNQKNVQDLNLSFKTDIKKELNLKAPATVNTTRQSELNVVTDSINKDFQAEQQTKRLEEAKKHEINLFK